MIRRPPRSTLFPSPPLFRSPRVLKYGSCQPYHFFGTVDPHRRASCDRAFGRLREIVGVGSDQYRHACRASLNQRSEEHTSELQSRLHLVCRLLLEKKKNKLEVCALSSLPFVVGVAVSPSPRTHP